MTIVSIVEAAHVAVAPRDLAAVGIRVNTSAPSMYRTPILDGLPKNVQVKALLVGCQSNFQKFPETRKWYLFC